MDLLSRQKNEARQLIQKKAELVQKLVKKSTVSTKIQLLPKSTHWDQKYAFVTRKDMTKQFICHILNKEGLLLVLNIEVFQIKFS